MVTNINIYFIFFQNISQTNLNILLFIFHKGAIKMIAKNKSNKDQD